ncbi:MAG TPA: MFS transporter [Usitatibacter sp.]|nr:MFS transporter [Usitatibacter sp.]
MSVQDIATPQEPPAVPTPPPGPQSPWEPLRNPTFRMLWLVWATSNVCMWANDVAAAWLMTSLTTSATLIAMVTTASSLPVFLLGLPSGALADLVDRRRYFMVTQVWVATNAAILYLVSITVGLTPTLLLLLVFTNGIGLAMRWPVYAAIVPELLGRKQLPLGLALNGIAVNVSRIVGPLVAGAIIAAAGSEYVFAMNCALSIGCAFVLLRWKRVGKPPSVLPGERFLGAMRLGWQYVRESRRMKDAIVVTCSFFLHATALIALLPLVAKRMMDGGAGIFTFLLAALGLGAIVAATQLPRLRHRWNRDELALRGSVGQSIATLVIALSDHVWTALPAMFLGGAAWIVTANSVSVAAQLALPDWVRARGMSIYQMAIMGGTAVGAFIWGRLAESTSVRTSLIACSASMLLALFVTRRRVLEGEQEEDHTPTHPWQEPVPAMPLEPRDGPVMITLEYLIDPQRRGEFESIMAESRSARLRQGAVSWGLFEDVQRPGRFVEYFACDTWADYLRRFDRFTAMDERLHAMRHSFHLGEEPPRISRFIAKHPPAR